MEPAEQQHDALTKLINIAFGRTAAALSDLTNRRILIEGPEVTIRPAGKVEEALRGRISEPLVTVHQPFSGALTGTAILAFDQEGAHSLVNLLIGEETSMPDLDTSAREVLVEVGNILLSACLSVFGNLLAVHLSFSMPRFRLDDLTTMLDTLTVRSEGELQYVIIAYATFRVQEEAVTGITLIPLGAPHLDRLLRAIEERQASYEERSVDG